MLRLLPLLAALSLTACSPAPHCEHPDGWDGTSDAPCERRTVRVAIDRSDTGAAWFFPDHRTWMGQGLRSWDPDSFIVLLVDEAEGYDLVLRPAVLGNCQTHGAGLYYVGTDLAEIDPACVEGEDEWRQAAAHELGHYLGLQHTCHDISEVDCSETWGMGRAVMNQHLAYTTPVSEGGDGYPTSSPAPTAIDLAQYRAVHP